MTLFTRRIALFVAAAIPFVLVPSVLAWSIGPMARVGARWCNTAAAVLSFAAESGDTAPKEENVVAAAEPADGDTPLDVEPGASVSGLRSAGSRTKAVPPGRAEPSGVTAGRRAVARRARLDVFVGPESIRRAIPAAGRPTSAWTNRTLQHPAGLLIQSPGALTGVIEPGDILVEAEGQPLSSFEQLIVTVKQAYERRAKRLSGRLFRKGDWVALTVEPGW